jgi:hypothetical protein
VEVVLRDGRTLRGEATHAAGSARAPLDEAERRTKFLTLAAKRLGAERAERLFELVMGLADAGDLALLTQALHQPAPPPRSAAVHGG